MIVSRETCQLFTVLRTNKLTGDVVTLTYAPTNYLTAVRRASRYQRHFDPNADVFYYRVHMAG